MNESLIKSQLKQQESIPDTDRYLKLNTKLFDGKERKRKDIQDLDDDLESSEKTCNDENKRFLVIQECKR